MTYTYQYSPLFGESRQAAVPSSILETADTVQAIVAG